MPKSMFVVHLHVLRVLKSWLLTASIIMCLRQCYDNSVISFAVRPCLENVKCSSGILVQSTKSWRAAAALQHLH